MALSKTTIFKGFEIKNTYIKITRVEGNKENLLLQVRYFQTKDSAEILEEKYYSFIPDVTATAKNFIEQGYEYLKTLDEYKDTIDILE